MARELGAAQRLRERRLRGDEPVPEHVDEHVDVLRDQLRRGCACVFGRWAGALVAGDRGVRWGRDGVQCDDGGDHSVLQQPYAGIVQCLVVLDGVVIENSVPWFSSS